LLNGDVVQFWLFEGVACCILLDRPCSLSFGPHDIFNQ
jgi:hypothetical protein